MLHITNFSSACVAFDMYADYIPVLSSVTNLTDLCLKYVVYPSASQSTRESSHYFAYLQTKNCVRTIISAIPILGNIINIINDIYCSMVVKDYLYNAEINDQCGDTLGHNDPNSDYYAIATRYYNSALNYGSTEAGYQIGLRFKTGKGLKQASSALSTVYLRAAAARGHSAAQTVL